MTTPVEVLESKLPAGFIMRPVQMEDVTGVVNIINADSLVHYGTKEYTDEKLSIEWNTPEVDPSDAFRVVLNPDGEIVGYIEAWIYQKPPVHPWLWGRVHPEYKGLGIGTAMMEWAMQRAAQVVDLCPPDARITYFAGCKTGDKTTEELYQNLGMNVIRHSWHMLIEMDKEPIVAPLPQGISIRAYRHDEDLESTLIATNEAFRDHWGFVEQPLEMGLKRWRYWIEEDKDFDENLWLLAIDDASGEIAAMSLSRAKAHHDNAIGWVNTLGVRRPWRKQGLGLAILQQSFLEFWKRGQAKVGLGVDAGSLTGATRLYEKAGMRVSRQYTTYEKEIRSGVEISTTTVEED